MDLRQGIIDTASALGVSPLDLATVISYETGGTFDPVQPGPTTQFGQHRGLIQFGEPQAKQHGVDWSNPAASQLGPDGAIASYMRGAGVQPGMGLLDIYSAVNAGFVGRYNASDANNGGAWGTVADKVNHQMDGHRKKAAALLGGELVAQDTMKALGRQPAPQMQSQPMVSTQSAQPQPEEEKLLGGLLSKDKRDYLIMALEGMTLNPNRALMATAAGNIKDRRETKKEKAQRNKTAAFIRRMGNDQLAQAVENGEISGSQGLQLATQQPKDDRTAMMKNYEFLVPLVGEKRALEMARGGQTINVNMGQDGIDYGDPGEGLVWQRDDQGKVVVDDRGAPVAIPYQGGKAWQKQQETQREIAQQEEVQKSREKGDATRSNATIRAIDQVLAGLKDKSVAERLFTLDPPEVGVFGSRLTGVSQEAKNIENALKTIGSTVAFDRLQAMREASPTGGALGQVSNLEIGLLKAALGNIENTNDPQVLRDNLMQVRKIMEKVAAYPNASEYGFAGDGTGRPDTDQGDPLGLR